MSSEHLEIKDLVDPNHTALLLVECQNGVIGENSSFPALAEASKNIIANLGKLAQAARNSKIKVVHGLAMIRNDDWGSNNNARLFEVGFNVESDVLLPRFHGLSPTSGTELDALLRNEGISTVVVSGVSLNVAVQNCVFDLINNAYQVVVPVDAVAGVPPEYGKTIIENTLAVLATLTDVESLIKVWS
jgi:nicotinamidase-related amidase